MLLCSFWFIFYAMPLTGHEFQLVHSGEDGGVAVLKEEDHQQCQGIVIEQGSSPTGVT